MITTVILGSIAILLAGVVAVIRSARQAVTGYEDDFGFHEGVDPRAENTELFLRDCARRARDQVDEIIVREEDTFAHVPIAPAGNSGI